MRNRVDMSVMIPNEIVTYANGLQPEQDMLYELSVMPDGEVTLFMQRVGDGRCAKVVLKNEQTIYTISEDRVMKLELYEDYGEIKIIAAIDGREFDGSKSLVDLCEDGFFTIIDDMGDDAQFMT